MEAIEKLVDAVNRLKPRAILLLDTNTLMDAPRLRSYVINAPGPFLLVVPQVVVNELVRLKLRVRDKREKALRALNAIGSLCMQGDPISGIDLGGDRWLITSDSPRPTEASSLEEDQIQGNLGDADAALLRLADACAQDCSDTRALLITRDKNLSLVARTRGRPACPLSSLRSREAMDKMIPDALSGEAQDIDVPALLDEILGPEEERSVKIAMTLEELRSERDDLVARGSGRLTYDEKRFPFRWTFPYENLANRENLEDYSSTLDFMDMPLDNVDFMGRKEEIPEPVREFVCRMLEDSGGWPDGFGELQSPRTMLRKHLLWLTNMGIAYGELFGHRAATHKGMLDPDEVERYDELSVEHDRLMKSVLDGTAKSVGRAYRSAFQLNEALCDLLGWDEAYDPEYGPFDLETALIEFLDIALDTWSVGETREADYTYWPFSWLEEEEAVVNDGSEQEKS